MRVERLRLRDFRTYAAADVAIGPGLTVLHGPNGAGKTNLLEALYFGCTSRSCRTANEREVVRFDAPAALNTDAPDPSPQPTSNAARLLATCAAHAWRADRSIRSIIFAA